MLSLYALGNGGTDTPILQGLISAADSHDGFSSESYSYLKNGLWWAGMLTSESPRGRQNFVRGAEGFSDREN